MPASEETRAHVEPVLSDLIAHYYRATAAHEAAVKRISSSDVRTRLQSHLDALNGHILELRMHVDAINGSAPSGPGLETVVTSGMVAAGSLIGDEAILKSVLQTENTVAKSLDKAAHKDTLTHPVRDAIKRQLSDAHHRRHWLYASLGIEDPDQHADRDEVIRGRAAPRTNPPARPAGQTTDI